MFLSSQVHLTKASFDSILCEMSEVKRSVSCHCQNGFRLGIVRSSQTDTNVGVAIELPTIPAQEVITDAGIVVG
ncbi:hypothetical protein HG15A2_17520 [Adhaeretor mobilis]|uniref:Uncharacterized protein n=1 Tax=Adhaeretor mobilis TaxID=1930276 RepID=A0A517MUC6_9BACT|nr:hypothetical protein HG15A2_17520 [Adhaeretor mobilis]